MKKAGKRNALAISFFITLSFVLLLFSGLTIPLDSFDPRLESLLGRFLERKVTIHGPVRINLSLQPVVELGGVVIDNPDDWVGKKSFLTVRKGQAQIDLLPLVKGKIHITDLEFEGVDLRLVTKADKSNNYSFSSLSSTPATESSEHELTGLDKVSLKDIQLNYFDESSGKKYVLAIDSAHGQGMEEKPLQFALQGTLLGQTCALEITGGTLYDLLYEKDSWPLSQGKLQVAETVLDVSGSLVRAQGENSEYLDLRLTGPDLDGIASLFDTELPASGEFNLAGHLSILPGEFRCLNVQLDVLNSSMHGSLVLRLPGKRPILAGTLLSKTIDQRLLTAFGKDDHKQEQGSALEENKEFVLPWDLLDVMDTDIHFYVDELKMNSWKATDIKAVLSLSNGDLIVPFSFVTMDTAITGRADILSSGSIPSLELSTHTADIELGTIIAAILGSEQLKGNISSFSLSANSRGKKLEELTKSLDLDLQLGSASLIMESGAQMSSKGFSLQRRAGNNYILTGTGEALENPFSLKAHLGGVHGKLTKSPFPVDIQLATCDTTLRIDAALQNAHSADFHFTVKGKNLCGIMEPVEQFLGSKKGFSSMGTGKISKDDWTVKFKEIKLGTFTIDATVEQKNVQGNPLLTASVHSSEIDIRSFFPVSGEKQVIEQEQATVVQKIPEDSKQNLKDVAWKETAAKINKQLTEWIPQRKLLSMDARVQLHIDKLETGKAKVSDILLSAMLEDGKLKTSPFHFTLLDQKMSGDVQVDLTNEDPEARFKFAASGIDLPKLYQEFGLDGAPEIKADFIAINIALKGRKIQDIPKKSSQEIIVRGGIWQIEREFGEPLRFAIQEATASNVPGKKASLSIKGYINSEPFSVLLEENGLLQPNTLKPIKGTVKIEIADTKLSFDGELERKKKKDESTVKTKYSMSGSSMDDLNWLSSVNLPPFGPYSINGTFYAEKGLFGFYDIILKVGDSNLLGEMIVNGTANEESDFDYPVNIQTKLQAKSIQLNDFQFGDWSPVAAAEAEAEAEAEEADTVNPDQEKDTENTDHLHNLFGPEIAGKFLGTLDVQVDEVLSGNDKLGNGVLKASLNDGLYSLESLQLEIPGGSVSIQGTFRPEFNNNSARLGMQIENLDYGVLARRTHPDSDFKGKMNVNFDLHSEAAAVADLKDHMNGWFRFGVMPEEYEADEIDLWAVNIVTAALPKLLQGTPSTVNCLAGKFLLEDGIMHPDTFLLDTSKMRVHGEGEVNFKTNGIDFHLHPTPKSPHFFSLATPVTVTGTLTDYDIGVSAGAVMGTVFQMASSVLTVPFQWLFTDNLDPDGYAACAEAMDWTDATDR